MRIISDGTRAIGIEVTPPRSTKISPDYALADLSEIDQGLPEPAQLWTKAEVATGRACSFGSSKP